MQRLDILGETLELLSTDSKIMTFCCSWIKLFRDLIKSFAWKGWNYESFDKMIANMRVGICHDVTAESHSAHVMLDPLLPQLAP